MERWVGRVALVVGASVEVCKAICRKLVQHGMTVLGCDTDVQKIQKLADEIGAAGPGELHVIQCDLMKESEILNMFDKIRKKFGCVDVLISNPEYCAASPIISGVIEEWRKILEINVLTSCVFNREFCNLVKEKKIEDGLIIRLGSIVSHRMPDLPPNGKSFFSIYDATEVMNRSLTDSLRQELKACNSSIRVATVTPGPVGPNLDDHEACKEIEEALQIEIDRTTMQWLPSRDVADAIIFILSRPPKVNVEDIVLELNA